VDELLPSLELVAEEVEAQLTTQLRHFEGLDTKAGIVLGFAGVLVALSGKAEGLLPTVGFGLAVLAALFSVSAFLPRGFPVLDVTQLREEYLTAEREFTTLYLLDTRVEMWRQAAEILRSKAFRLKLALVSLAVAVIAFTASILFA
jgi:hypothetical protein